VKHADYYQFTATMDGYMRELYSAADAPPLTAKTEPQWIKVQRAVFSKSRNAERDLERMIQLMAQSAVRLPIMRKAVVTDEYAIELTTNVRKVEVKKGDTIILDLVSVHPEPLFSSVFTQVSLSRRPSPKPRSRATSPRCNFSLPNLALPTSMVYSRQDASPPSR
jgi:hypothetical protein